MAEEIRASNSSSAMLDNGTVIFRSPKTEVDRKKVGIPGVVSHTTIYVDYKDIGRVLWKELAPAASGEGEITVVEEEHITAGGAEICLGCILCLCICGWSS